MRMDARIRRNVKMSRRERIATALMALLVLVGIWQSYGVLLEPRDELPLQISP
jgi:hypothetical protein